MKWQKMVILVGIVAAIAAVAVGFTPISEAQVSPRRLSQGEMAGIFGKCAGGSELQGGLACDLAVDNLCWCAPLPFLNKCSHQRTVCTGFNEGACTGGCTGNCKLTQKACNNLRDERDCTTTWCPAWHCTFGVWNVDVTCPSGNYNEAGSSC